VWCPIFLSLIVCFFFIFLFLLLFVFVFLRLTSLLSKMQDMVTWTELITGPSRTPGALVRFLFCFFHLVFNLSFLNSLHCLIFFCFAVPDWGMSGYFLIRRGQGTCGINLQVAVPQV
jgi:hypothetical protein